MNKLVPWGLSAILTLALAGVVIHFHGVVKDKDAQLEATAAKLSLLAAESDAKLREANTKIERLAAATQQMATEARAKIAEVTQEASQRLAAANLPEATIAVSFRKAFFSSGNVAIFQNTSAQSTGVSLFVSRPSVGRQRAFEVVLDPRRAKEIGEREGWAFLPGDSVKVEQPGHKSLVFTVQ